MSTITPHYRTVQQLLQSQSFSIDEYQREYKWEKKHVDELLSDLYSKFDAGYDEGDTTQAVAAYDDYFLGSIIVSKRDNKSYLIDGQQRVTSLSLLLIYLHHEAKRRERAAAEAGDEQEADAYQALRTTVAPLIFSNNLGKPSFNLDIPERLPVIEALFFGKDYNPDGRDESVRTIYERYASTGLSISEGGGAVSGLADADLVLEVTISLVPTVQGSLDAIALDDLTLTYTFGTSLVGSGNVSVFDQGVASATVELAPDRVAFEGGVNFLDIIVGTVGAAVSSDSDSETAVLEGQSDARLMIPALSGFPFDYISAQLGLPYTISRTQSQLDNTSLSGYVRLTGIFELAYELAWGNGALASDFGGNFVLFNQALFDAEHLMGASPNRFEGYGLVFSSARTNPQLRQEAGSLQQSFSLESEHTQLVLRLQADAVPQYTVVLPDGREISAADVDSYPNVEYADSPADGKAFFAFRNPPIGEWTIEVGDGSEYTLHVYADDVPPTLRNLELGGSSGRSLQAKQRGPDLVSGNVEITWTDDDPDSDAEIRIFYDVDSGGADGTLIATGISEDDEDDRVTWDVSSVPTGEYSVYASVHDGVNGRRVTYAPDPVKVVEEGAPDPPTHIFASTSSEGVSLRWEPPSGAPDGMQYVAYYAARGRVSYRSPFVNMGFVENGGSGPLSRTLDKLVPGRTYEIALTALDSLSRESDLSEIVEVTYTASEGNNHPLILDQDLPSVVRLGGLLGYEIETFDADGDPLAFELIEAPDGMTVSDGGSLAWTPEPFQRGRWAVTCRVADPAGAADSVSFYVDVLDAASSRGIITFNRGRYDPEDPLGYVELLDLDVNTSPAVRDTQRVALTSDSQTGDVELLLQETQDDSGVFTGSFAFSSGGTEDAPELEVSAGDSIRVAYSDLFPEAQRVAWAVYGEAPTTDTDPGADVPIEFAVRSPYPNPARSVVALSYELPEHAHVTVELYNVLGQRVAVLLDEERAPGSHIMQWERGEHRGLASGVYIYRVTAVGDATSWTRSMKVMLLR